MGEIILFLTGGTAADRLAVWENSLKPSGHFHRLLGAVSRPRRRGEPEWKYYWRDEEFFRKERFITEISTEGEGEPPVIETRRQSREKILSFPNKNTFHSLFDGNGKYLKGITEAEFVRHFPNRSKWQNADHYGHVIYDVEQPSVEIPQMIAALEKKLLTGYRFVTVKVLSPDAMRFLANAPEGRARANVLMVGPTYMQRTAHAMELPENCIVYEGISPGLLERKVSGRYKRRDMLLLARDFLRWNKKQSMVSAVR